MFYVLVGGSSGNLSFVDFAECFWSLSQITLIGASVHQAIDKAGLASNHLPLMKIDKNFDQLAAKISSVGDDQSAVEDMKTL